MSRRRLGAAIGLVALGVCALIPPAAAAASVNGKTIVIDPGHGGKDPGAIANGVQEKAITLAVGQQLAGILQAEGARVIMTRSADTDPAPSGSVDDDLEARVTMAQQAHANAFVSIHGNESADPNVSGATTFYGPVCGFYSGVKLSPTDVGRSYSLAQKVQAAVVSRSHEHDDGSQSAAFWVLGNPGIPAILVETAFLSNKGDVGKLVDGGYQHLLADAIADGVEAFFASGDATGTPPAPKDSLVDCSSTAPKDDRGQGQSPPERWVQTIAPAPLLSGADAKAKLFATLAPFTYLKVLGQRGDFLNVLNPATNGPGFVDAKKVGPSGPPRAAPAFEPFWVESFRPTQLWSGPDDHALSFGPLATWSYLQVLAPGSASRFKVRIAATGHVAYVDRADVGPSGPPPASSAAPAPAASPAPKAALPGPASTNTLVVAAGDTLSAIAANAGVSVADLITLNHLNADGAIQIGQKLVVPSHSASTSAAIASHSATSITVAAGETLSAIASRLGVSVQALVDLNHLASPDDIQAGQTLKAPASS